MKIALTLALVVAFGLAGCDMPAETSANAPVQSGGNSTGNPLGGNQDQTSNGEIEGVSGGGVIIRPGEKPPVKVDDNPNTKPGKVTNPLPAQEKPADPQPVRK